MSAGSPKPIPVEVQIGLIWAVQNGFVADVPIERVKRFQAGWTDFLVTRKPDLLAWIVREKALGPELIGALEAAANQFTETWKK